MKKIRLLEGYAGNGGASFCLKKAKISFECVGYSEIHPGQIKIYNQNHPNIKNYGDITKINPKELPDFDLITGGFPCQDVSIAGLRDLKKGRTTSVFKLLDIIKEKKPKYCLLENVQGIMSIHKGELLAEIVRKLKSMGYAVSYKLLYSKDYGNPQNRPRVWIACELGRDSFLYNPFPPKEELKLFVQDLLEENVDESYYLNETQIKRIIRRSEVRGKPLGSRINPRISSTITTHQPKSNPADSIYISSNIARTITAGDYSHTNVHNQHLIEESKFPLDLYNFKICDDGICPTLTDPKHNTLRLIEKVPIIHSLQPRTSKTGKGGSGPLKREDNIAYTIDTGNTQAIEYKDRIRVLTPRECFRLQGYHDDEIDLQGISKTSAYFSAGNGWDINLGSKILKEMLKDEFK